MVVFDGIFDGTCVKPLEKLNLPENCKVKIVVEEVSAETQDELFGIWADDAESQNVDLYIRNMRGGRSF